MSTRRKCCNNAGCTNGTGCGSAQHLCTGLRFVILAVNSVSISGSQSGNEADDPYLSGYAYAYFRDTNGTVAGNAFTHPRWSSFLASPPISSTYSASFSAPSANAFRDPRNSGCVGFKYTANIGGSSYSFDGMTGTGASLSFSMTAQDMAKGSWAVGPDSSGSTIITESSIDAYDFSDSNPVEASIEASYVSVGWSYDAALKKFTYGVFYEIYRAEYYVRTRTWYYTTKTRRRKTTSPTYDYTVYRELSEATLSTKSALSGVVGLLSGTSSTVSGACTGSSGSITVIDADRAPADGSPRFYPHDASAAGGGAGAGLVPRSGATWPPAFSTLPISSPFSWVSGTGPTGSASMSIDLTPYTETRVGFRDCPRYLNVTGTLTHIVGDSSATVSGRIVQNGVDSCQVYEGIWATNGTSATATVDHPGIGSCAATITVTWQGPSLWLCSITWTASGSNYSRSFYATFAGSCPVGSPVICQQMNLWGFTTTGATSANATHDYGDLLLFDGSSYSTSPFDDWSSLGHTATAADLGTITAGPSGVSDVFTSHSLTFTETDRAVGDPDYYCSGYVWWHTGEEVDADGNDLHWRKKIGSGSYAPAVLQTSNPFLTFYYNGDGSGDGKWIGTDAAGTGQVDDHTYETYIIADGTPESDFGYDISADNYVTALEINGVIVATNLTPNDVTSHEQSWTGTIYAADLVEGRNTIRFIHEDQGDVEGFRCRFYKL